MEEASIEMGTRAVCIEAARKDSCINKRVMYGETEKTYGVSTHMSKRCLHMVYLWGTCTSLTCIIVYETLAAVRRAWDWVGVEVGIEWVC